MLSAGPLSSTRLAPLYLSAGAPHRPLSPSLPLPGPCANSPGPCQPCCTQLRHQTSCAKRLAIPRRDYQPWWPVEAPPRLLYLLCQPSKYRYSQGIACRRSERSALGRAGRCARSLQRSPAPRAPGTGSGGQGWHPGSRGSKLAAPGLGLQALSVLSAARDFSRSQRSP